MGVYVWWRPVGRKTGNTKWIKMFLLVVRHKSWAFYMFTYNNISVGQLLLNTGQSRGGLSFRKSYTGLYKTQDFCRQFSISYMFIYLQIRLEVQHWCYMFTQNDIYKSIHNPLSARPAVETEKRRSVTHMDYQ